MNLPVRQRQALSLICKGMSNKQIALEMGIEVNTVKTNLQGLYTRLGVRTRLKAAVYALRNGIVA